MIFYDFLDKFNADRVLIESIKKGYNSIFESSEYIGQCDKIRCGASPKANQYLGNIDKNQWWNDVLSTAIEISKEEFLSVVDPYEVLDDDEEFDQWIDSDCSFWKNDDIYFIKTSGTNGFEFFWKILD